MSRATVRAAVQAYLAPANSAIPFLGNVYAHPAKFTPEGEFYDGQDPGHSTGAVIYIYISEQVEHRIALGGPHAGEKAVEYMIHMDCFIRSQGQRTEDAGADSDTFLDALVAFIRADRNAGKPSVIFQWGEGTFPGGSDIQVDALYPRPVRAGNQVSQVFASVRTKVVEIVKT
jgi:hypothetical protein